MFVIEHALFGATRAAAFLSTNLFHAGAFGVDVTPLSRFNFVEQKSPRKKTVESLLSRGLAFDLKPCWSMDEHDARGGLVDVLSAVTAGVDELLFQIGFTDAERGHALRKLGFFLRADGKHAHRDQRSDWKFPEQAVSGPREPRKVLDF